MKTKIIFFVALFLLGTGNLGLKDLTANEKPRDHKMTILSTPDLYDLSNKWSSEFAKLNPHLNIEVIRISKNEMPEILVNNKHICFISKKYADLLGAEKFWHLVIGRDVIVPIINSNNPYVDQIYEKGIAPAALARILNNPEMMNWGTLLQNDRDIPLNLYILNDESIKSGIAEFLAINPEAVHGKFIESRIDVVQSIQNDPFSIGFCKMTDIIDLNIQSFVDDISILPFDQNENGKIDYYEDIYSDLYVFSRGVWMGKYPKKLNSNIYTISAEKPDNDNEVAFLRWVLTDGQEFLNMSGYSDLALGERQMKLEKLRPNEIVVEDTGVKYAIQKIILLVVVGLFALGLILNAVLRRRKHMKESAQAGQFSSFNEHSVETPNGLFFDKSHTWAFMEKDGVVKIGIDDFLRHVTGPLTRIKLKNPGDKISKGEKVVTLIQNGKQLNIQSPVSGTIQAINEELIANPVVLNDSPYVEGWIYMIQPSNWLREIQFLSMANKYKEWLKNEFARLKDFIAISAKAKTLEYAQLVLQEGGELKDNVLADFGPEIWEDFQKNMIDSSTLA